jgi:RimJ/RimL family protein N-acetyltransferase
VGGQPSTLAELRERYGHLVSGPEDGDEIWLNWTVRSRAYNGAVGSVQATVVTTPEGRQAAYVAWTIGVEWQRRGFATEAACALIGWLQDHGAQDIIAHIHPEHHASAAVASRAGLHPTDEEVDGEVVWRLRQT